MIGIKVEDINYEITQTRLLQDEFHNLITYHKFDKNIEKKLDDILYKQVSIFREIYYYKMFDKIVEAEMKFILDFYNNNYYRCKNQELIMKEDNGTIEIVKQEIVKSIYKIKELDYIYFHISMPCYYFSRIEVVKVNVKNLLKFADFHKEIFKEQEHVFDNHNLVHLNRNGNIRFSDRYSSRKSKVPKKYQKEYNILFRNIFDDINVYRVLDFVSQIYTLLDIIDYIYDVENRELLYRNAISHADIIDNCVHYDFPHEEGKYIFVTTCIEDVIKAIPPIFHNK